MHASPAKLPRAVRKQVARPRKLKEPVSARERLLAALSAAPRLSAPDADRINQAVQAAREASLGDDLSACTPISSRLWHKATAR